MTSKILQSCSVITILAIISIATGQSTYSTSGGVINGSTISIDSLPTKSYTHYLSESTIQEYSFIINASAAFDGLFINVGRFELMKESTIRKKFPKICQLLDIQFTYPSGSKYSYCRGTEIYESPPELIGDGGSIAVKVTRKLYTYNLYSHYSSRNLFSRYDGYSKPLQASSGRTIPASVFGALTFTAYRDCSANNSLLTPSHQTLRPCSEFGNHTCIDSRLFCNGEVNCQFSILDYFLTNRTDNFIDDYDESEQFCAQRTRIWESKNTWDWESKTWNSESKTTFPKLRTYTPNTSYGYSSSYSSGYSKTLIIIPIGLILSLLGACLRFAKKKEDRPNTRNGQQEPLNV